MREGAAITKAAAALMDAINMEKMFSDLYVRDICLEELPPRENYLHFLPAIRSLYEQEKITLTKKVTFFVGENGIGKSTLIEGIAIALGFNPEGGSKNFNFVTQDSHSSLHEYLKICRGIKKPRDGFFLRAESFYNVASNIDELDREVFGLPLITQYGGTSLHAQSHGESFLSLVENRFRGNGLYILDEPEAALSPARLLRLICNIDRLVKDDSQFIIATHSPILMAFPDSEVLLLSEDGIRSVSYKETEHYTITKRFLSAPEKMLEELLEK